MNLTKPVMLFAAAAAAAILAGAPALAQAPYPNQRLNWTIAFGPGGGNDIMSRTLISILEKYKFYPQTIVAENRPGGSGAKGWGFLFSQKGDPYHISTTSGSFITTPLQANTPWQPASFTPVALLASDDMLLVVNKNSKIRSLKEFVAAAKAKPPSIGGIGAVNIDFIVPKLVSEKAGFTFNYVSFNKQGELITALLSSSLDAAMSNPGEVMGLLQSGDMRALAFSGKSTPKALGDVPTFAELGYDIGIALPRGLVLPPDVPKEAQQWWIDTMKKVVQTPEWKAYIDKQLLTENVLYGEDFRAFLTKTQGVFADILRKSGSIK
ncbi:MAG: tripartite tricarboxylate transporter substrate binding protein [Betaproteobacteria bacterium]|nr:tripartite tricarboxylate transporter substrate binding protein [Betaproteobacteria bacterium]